MRGSRRHLVIPVTTTGIQFWPGIADAHGAVTPGLRADHFNQSIPINQLDFARLGDALRVE